MKAAPDWSVALAPCLSASRPYFMATSLPSISSRTEDPQPGGGRKLRLGGGGQGRRRRLLRFVELRVAAVRGSLSEDATLETERLPQRFNLQDWRRVQISFALGSSIPPPPSQPVQGRKYSAGDCCPGPNSRDWQSLCLQPCSLKWSPNPGLLLVFF